MRGSTSGEGTAYLFKAPEFTSVSPITCLHIFSSML